MFRALLLSLLCASPMLAFGGALNPVARQLACQAQHVSTHLSRATEDTPPEARYAYPVIVKLTSGNQELPSEFPVLCRRGDLVVVLSTAEQLEALGANPVVKRVEASLQSLPSMDHARQYSGLADTQAGVSPLPKGYDGTGVVVGFVDTGFDPNHIAFRDPLTGVSRVKRLINYHLCPDSAVVLDAPAAIAAWTNDNPSTYHATHVAGILAGGYKGNPYYGVATGADIVAVTAPLYSGYLIAGCEEILAYANQHGVPAVINISVAEHTGAHDGTSLFNQYMERLGQDAVIVISAGNEGQAQINNRCSFTSSNNRVRTYPNSWGDWSAGRMNQAIDIWSLDDSGFTAKVVVHNRETGKTELIYDALNAEQLADIAAGKTVEWGICSSDYAEQTGLPTDSAFSACTSGCASIIAERCSENGRFNIYFSTSFSDPLPFRYGVGIEVRGNEGQTLEIYGSQLLSNFWDSTAIGGTTWRNINNLVCGRSGVISTGMMVTRNEFPHIGQEVTCDSSLVCGSVSPHSSFGTLNDGRALPNICAPGYGIISAVSEYWVKANPSLLPAVSYSQTSDDGHTYYWDMHGGTSMASPYVAGIAALWLQADPTLSPAKILEIMQETAQAPTIDPSDPRWGSGIIDAYAGLRRVLAGAGIAEVEADDRLNMEVLPLGSGSYELRLPWPVDATQAAILRVCDLQGRCLSQWRVDTSDFQFSLGEQPAGVYFLIFSDDSHKPQTIKLHHRQ